VLEIDGFRQIPSLPEFFVSKDGRFKQMRVGRGIMKPRIRKDKNGRVYVTLVKHGQHFVDDLLAETWPEDKNI
jgi:hypothetical protein